MSDQSTLDFLSSLEAFSVFQGPALERLAAAAQVRSFEFGQLILNAGDTVDGLYAIRSGRVRLFVAEQGREKSIETREAGDVFAEIAMVRTERVEYSVRASSAVEVLFLPHDLFPPLVEGNQGAQDFLARYIALKVAGGIVTKLFDLRKRVDRAETEEIISSIGIKRVKAGQQILTQDSVEDQRLYVIREGEVEISRADEGTTYTLFALGPGEIFGEKACLTFSGQLNTAVAKTDAVLLLVPATTAHKILERNPTLVEVLNERIDFSEKEFQRQIALARRRSRRLLLDLWSRPKNGEKVLRRFPLVEQTEPEDSGAACLSMICKYYDITMKLGKLKEMSSVGQGGATPESLTRVGESLGFAAKSVRCEFSALLGLEIPFVAQCEGARYVAVYGISRKHVWTADPATGFKKLSVSEFERQWTGNCVVFSPTVALQRVPPKSSPWLRFVGYLKPFKKIVTDLLLAALVIQIMSLATPIIIQNILDRVVVHQNFQLLNVMIIGLAIAMLFGQLTQYISAYLAMFMIRKMDFNMMSHFYKHVLSLPMDFFAKRKTGEIIARFQENDTIRRFMTETSINTVLNALIVFTYISVMFLYNVKLTLLLLIFVPLIILATALATPKYKDFARRSFSAGAAADSLLVETLGGAETIKAMGTERVMRLKWEKKYTESLDLRYRTGIFIAMISIVSQSFKAAATLTLLWAGSTMVLKQELTIGQLMAFNALIAGALGPLINLVTVWDEVNETLVAMEKLGDVLDLDPEQKPEEISSRVILDELKGDIRLENVYFRYGGAQSPYILDNINLEIKAGSTVAIVGHSGSGKTTLARLLVGFYRPTEGKILIDGYDITTLDMEYYRARIGYVMQSNLLFSGTISENIAAGNDDVDPQRIREVARLADADGFVSNLPLGYEQVVGERGLGLSGGQMQRVCIARALYHDPRLIILDEATSALDSDSESHIQSNMRKILAGRTAVIIAHRLSTVMDADKILVLYDGAIVEEGTHQELIAKKGMYHHLAQRQLAAGQTG